MKTEQNLDADNLFSLRPARAAGEDPFLLDHAEAPAAPAEALLGPDGLAHPALLDDLYAGATEAARLQRFLGRFTAATGSDGIAWACERLPFGTDEEHALARQRFPVPGRVRGFTMSGGDASIESASAAGGSVHAALLWFAEYGEALPFLALHRDVERGPYSDEELASIQRFVPHLRNVMRLWCARAQCAAKASVALGMLECAGIGVMLCSSSGELRWQNDVAEGLLAHPSVGLVRGRLRLSDVQTTRAFYAAVEEAISGRLEESCVLYSRDLDGNEVQLLVAPAGLSSTWRGQRSAVVLVVDPRSRTVDPSSVRQLWGLTPSEARVTCELSLGRSVDAIADSGGVQVETVRTQLKAAYGKTCTRSQAELVSLVLRSLPALGFPTPEAFEVPEPFAA